MTNSEIAKASRKNKAKLNKTLIQINRNLNQAIKEGNKEVEEYSIRFYIVLYVAWLEATLLFFLFEHDSHINDGVREQVLKQQNQVAKWQFLIDYFFRRYYMRGKTGKAFSIQNMGHSAYHRHIYLSNLLQEKIKIFIEIRNKLAHGQWQVALTSDLTGKSQDLTAKVWTLSKKEIWIAKQIITTFSKLVEQMITSKSSFERIFDHSVQTLEFNINKHGENFHKVLEMMHRRWSKVEVNFNKK